MRVGERMRESRGERQREIRGENEKENRGERYFREREREEEIGSWKGRK